MSSGATVRAAGGSAATGGSVGGSSAATGGSVGGGSVGGQSGQGGSASTCPAPTLPAQSAWSPKAPIARADCSNFASSAMFRSGACLDGTEVVALSDNGGVAVLFGSTIRARWLNGQWSALLTKPVPHNNEPAYRPWLSPCGDRFFVSFRDRSGANSENSVLALTIEADDWARPLSQWNSPAAVGDNGFTASRKVPAPPAAPSYFYDDMVLSDDGSRAVLTASPGTAPTRLLEWDGALWRDLEAPVAIDFVQWPGAWTAGQGGLVAPADLAINSSALFVYSSGRVGPTRFFEYSGGAWATRPGVEDLHFQFKVARDEDRAIVGEIQGSCAVWTGTDWTFSDNSASALENERTIGISADGNLAVCAGDNDGLGLRSYPSSAHAAPLVSVWNGHAWNSQSLGDASCLVRDVAVAQNGALAVVALTCDTTTGTAPGLPHVELAEYRKGAWSLGAIADSYVVPGIGSTKEGMPLASYDTVGIDSAGPRIAVSADGTSAVAVWGEPGGAYAAYYR